MDDLYSIPNVTIFGSNGLVALAGIATADIISIAFTDDHTIVEQHNGVNAVTGAVAHNQKGDINLTFYPIPSDAVTEAKFAAQSIPVTIDAADYAAIQVPEPLSEVYLIRKSPAETPSSPGQLPSSIASGNSTPGTAVGGTDYRRYWYIGGGTMNFTANGLMTMTLPCRRWVVIDTN